MSDVGAIAAGGAAGGAGGAGGASGAGGSQSVSPATSAPDVGKQGTGTTVAKSDSDNPSSSSAAATQINLNPGGQPCMSTQDFASLHSMTVEEPVDTSMMDLNKLIEMIIAIKLLEALNDTGKSGGGESYGAL